MELIGTIEVATLHHHEKELPPGGENIIPLNAQSIVDNRVAKNSQPKNRYLSFVRIAASLAMIAIVSYLIYSQFGWSEKRITTSDLKQITTQSPFGQRTTVLLGDGSKVIINSGGSISYTKPFAKDKRVITLNGEAFFEVAKDQNRPFQVISGGVTTVALGTSFNVFEGPEQEQLRISLLTGKVGVGFSDETRQNVQYLLNPGEQILFSRVDSTFTKGGFNLEEVTSWKDGIIYFKDADEATVINKLEQWYGIDIIVQNSPGSQWDLTAKFDNQSLINVLRSLGFTMNFEFTIEDQQVLIKF